MSDPDHDAQTEPADFREPQDALVTELLEKLTPAQLREVTIADMADAIDVDPLFERPTRALLIAVLEFMDAQSGMRERLEKKNELVDAAPSIDRDNNKWIHCIPCDTAWNTERFLEAWRDGFGPVVEGYCAVVEKLDAVLGAAIGVSDEYRNRISDFSERLVDIAAHLRHLEIARYANGTIYLIQEAGSGYYKIGWSRVPEVRARSMKTGNPRELRIVARIPGSPADEKALHRKFHGLRANHGGGEEWFQNHASIPEFFATYSASISEQQGADGEEEGSQNDVA
jgi:hypothetical protein